MQAKSRFHRSLPLLTIAGLMVLGMNVPIARGDIATGLIAYYPFDQDARSHNGLLNGVPHGGTTFSSTGKVGGCVVFNGTDGYVEIVHNTALSFDLSSQSYTIAFWVKTSIPPPVLPNHTYVWVSDRSGANTSYLVALTPSVPDPCILNVNGRPPTSVTWASNDPTPCAQTMMSAINEATFAGTWHHIAVVYDHTNYSKTFYIDGASVGAYPSAHPQCLSFNGCHGLNNTRSSTTYVGGIPSTGGSNSADSAIDELRFYSRALSEAEIDSLKGTPSLQWASRVLEDTPSAAGSLPAQRAVGAANASTAADPSAQAASPGYGARITLAFDNARLQRRAAGESDVTVVVVGRNTGAIVQVQVDNTVSCGVSPIAIGEIVDNFNDIREIKLTLPSNTGSQSFDAISFVDVVDVVRHTPPAGSPRLAIDAVFVSPLRPTSPPPVADAIPLAYPGLPARTPGRRNLVLVTHGWNDLAGSGCDGQLWTDQMAGSIIGQLAVSGTVDDWDVRSYRWEQYAGGFLTYPQVAASRAGEIGRQLGVQIAGMGYEHVHIIAHSAGTWLGGEAAEALGGTPITVHLTLLDAYVPGWNKAQLEAVLQQPNVFCDHYFDYVGPDLSLFDRCPLAIEAPHTSARLRGAYNVDVTQRNNFNTGCLLSFDLGDNAHAHPRVWYKDTVAPPCSGPGSPTAPCDYPLGFPMSKEYLGASWSVPTLKAIFPPYPSSSLLTLGREPASLSETTTRLDAVLGCAAASWVPGSSGVTGCVNDILGLITGSPVWANWPISIDQDVNFVELSYRSVASGAASGVLSIFWNGVPVYSVRATETMSAPATVRFAVPRSSAPASPVLTIRVDPDNAAPVQFEVSAIRTGLEDEQICLAITDQPANTITCRFGAATFVVTPLGTSPTYQWRFIDPDSGLLRTISEGVNLDSSSTSGAPLFTAAGTGTHTLSLTPGEGLPNTPWKFNVCIVDCIVTNACGSVTSNPATLTVCRADFDCSGARTVDDIFIFINAWFTHDPRCDVSTPPDGVTVDDIFIYLNLWFAGC